jgi:hypothetical protein
LGSDGAVIILRRSFWLSPQVSALSVTARSLLVELTVMYTGPQCNGRLFLSQVDAARRLGLSDRKAIKSAFEELEELGFLRCTFRGDFRVKAGGRARASTYWLNWKSDKGSPLGAEAVPPLNFSALDKRQKRRVEQRSGAMADYTKAFFAGEDSSHWAVVRAVMASTTGRESSHANPENGGNALPLRWEESSQHVYYQGGRGLMSRIDIMRAAHEHNAATSFVSSPEPGPPLFCGLIKLRRHIKDRLKKSGPIKNCERCGGSLDPQAHAGRRLCSETCHKAPEPAVSATEGGAMTRLEPGARFIGKRCDTSQNIGREAWVAHP